jgi:hypothetical protein
MNGNESAEAKGAIQYQRLTPLGGSGLSALGLGLSNASTVEPPKRERYALFESDVATRRGLKPISFSLKNMRISEEPP